MTSQTIEVPGAVLYCEIRGNESAPPLFLIPGGPTDADIYTALAERMSEKYRVIAYDPRGNSRSTFHGKPKEQDMLVHADDLAKLVELFGGGGSAYIFGNSGGAQIGLCFAARFPNLVRKIVAHEPPCVSLLADAKEQLQNLEAVHQTYLSEGASAAMGVFLKTTGMTRPREQINSPSATPRAPSPYLQKNLEYFVAHGVRPIGAYLPDTAALLTNAVQVAVGIGEESDGELAHRTAVALAEKLKQTPVRFPGGHSGFVQHAAAFADALTLTLD